MEFARELPLNQRTVLKVVAKLYETILRIKLLASPIPSRLIIPESVQPYFKIKINEIFCWIPDRFHYDSSLDQVGGQRKQAIRWEQSRRNSSEWAARSLEPLPWNSESRRLALPWYGIRCIETVTIMVAWSVWARERKEYLALRWKLPRAFRLQNATIPFKAKFPISYQSDHYLTVLMIQDCHKRVLHNGVGEILAELRSRF